MAIIDQLESFWSLEEASGTRVDAHGSNDLTDNNTVLSATGKVGDGADFETSNSEYLSHADDASLRTGDIDFTFCAWVQFETVGVAPMIVTKEDNVAGRHDYGLYHFGEFAFHINQSIIAESDVIATAGPWYFVLGWHDAANNSVNIRINNGAIKSVDTAGAVPQTSVAEFRIGARQWSGSEQYFDGIIDQVGFWKRMLHASEQDWLYNSGNGRSYAEIVAGFTPPPSGVFSAVTYGKSVAAATTLALTNHVVAAGQKLLVFANDATGVTWNGSGSPVALTKIAESSPAGAGNAWLLTTPTAGTATVVITSPSALLTGVAMSCTADFSGVNAILQTASGASTTTSQTESSAVGEIVIDWLHVENTAPAFVVGAGQTVLGTPTSGPNHIQNHAVSWQDGAASVEMSWTHAGTFWGHAVLLGVVPLIAPTAVDDTYSTPYQTLLTVSAGGGVLDNDTPSASGGPFTAVLDTDVSNGTLSLASDGSFTYTPDDGFDGADSFTYHANDDGGDSSIVTVTITVSVATSLIQHGGGIIEHGYGGSYRLWMRDRGPTCARHFSLGDCVGTTARDDLFDVHDRIPIGGTGGVYVGSPAKGYGLLPEWGLATTFDGVDDRVTFGTTTRGAGNEFTLTVLVRPAAGGMGTTRCIVRTGAAGAGYMGINSSNQATFGVRGGTLIPSAAALEAGHQYLIVGTYDGTNGRLYVGELLEGAAVAVAGPTALTFTAGFTSGQLGSNNSDEWFEGEMQGYASLIEAIALADIEELHATGIWTDVSADVHCPITWDRGIHGDRPDQRLAATGKLTYSVDNSTLNQAGLLGRYTPGHANAVAGFDRGTPVRFSLFIGSARYIKFLGAIQTLAITPGEYLQRDVPVMALDWMHEAAKASLVGLPVQQDVTADELILLMIDGMDNRPHGIDIDAGTDTYPVALHNIQDETATVQSELVRLTTVEQGIGAMLANGTFRFEARTVRQSASGVDYTLDKIRDTDPERSGTQFFNRVKGTVHPSRVDETDDTILYSNLGEGGSPSNGQPLAIDHGAQMKIFLPFTDPQEKAQRVGALSIQTPAANVDLFINSLEDLSGIDLTNTATITYSFDLEGGNGAYLNITNEWGQRVYLVVRLFGQGVYDYEPVHVISEDGDSIRRHGLQELTIDFPYLSNPSTAQRLCDYIRLSSLEAPTRLRTLTFKLSGDDDMTEIGVNADISTRLAIEEVMSAVDRVFTINGERGVYKDGPDVDITYWLVPTLQSGSEGAPNVWVLGTSALGINTRLAA